MMLSSELSDLGVVNTESIVRACFDEAGVQADDHFKALMVKLDNQHQHTLAKHNDQHKALISTLDTQHSQQLSIANKHQQTLVSKVNNYQSQLLASQSRQNRSLSIVRRAQFNILSRQNRSIKLASRKQKQISSIATALHHVDAKVTGTSSTTIIKLNDLAADVKQLLSSKGHMQAASPNQRRIYFFGKSLDHIIACILPVQHDLDHVLDHLLSYYADSISTAHVEKLRSEFYRLVDSAIQEKAAQHSKSTATSIDQWIYPERTIGYLETSSRLSRSQRNTHTSVVLDQESPSRLRWPQKQTLRPQKSWSVWSPSGLMRIALPHARSTPQGSEEEWEVSVSCNTKQSDSLLEIQARFWQDSSYAEQPQLCAQLNIFLQVSPEQWAIYDDIFCQGSLAEIDSSLRNGTISLFHVNEGVNACLFVSVCASSEIP
jgi:hypothetical protein